MPPSQRHAASSSHSHGTGSELVLGLSALVFDLLDLKKIWHPRGCGEVRAAPMSLNWIPSQKGGVTFFSFS